MEQRLLSTVRDCFITYRDNLLEVTTDLEEHAIYSGRPLFEIEELIASRENDETGKQEIRVKWKNFGPEWESREPAHNLEADVPELLHRFLRTEPEEDSSEAEEIAYLTAF